ncbi:MAG: transporter associated domain-containing protein [Pseudomonadota bacterium]
MNADQRSGNSSFSARLLERLLPANNNEPETKAQLVELLRQAKNRTLFNTDALAMMEGVLQVSDLRVRDIMIPRAQMVVLKRDATLPDILPTVTRSAHSRFPVIGEDRANVVGTLLAKDLLHYFTEPERFKMRDVLRPAVYVPESKPLDVLLKEFRSSRNHIAIVIDEYGAAAGLVTIEDVLEQIVGDIADEYDFDEGTSIMQRDKHTYTVKAQTPLSTFNDYFHTNYTSPHNDTIGGLVLNALGHLPDRGEQVTIAPLTFSILAADSRRIRLLSVNSAEHTQDAANSSDAQNQEAP